MRTGSICGISKHMQQAADIEESGVSLLYLLVAFSEI